jgi:hypothetical protein
MLVRPREFWCWLSWLPKLVTQSGGWKLNWIMMVSVRGIVCDEINIGKYVLTVVKITDVVWSVSFVYRFFVYLRKCVRFSFVCYRESKRLPSVEYRYVITGTTLLFVVHKYVCLYTSNTEDRTSALITCKSFVRLLYIRHSYTFYGTNYVWKWGLSVAELSVSLCQPLFCNPTSTSIFNPQLIIQTGPCHGSDR